MPNLVQLNYEELQKFTKYFHNESEDTTQLLSDTRQRVQDLRHDWTGDAADAFFSEMEGELLPALKRLAHALDFAQDKLGDIMKIIHGADEEAAGFFKSDDFGAGQFQAALGGLTGGVLGSGGVPPGGPGGDDFGASQFGQAVADVQPGGGSSGGGEDFGAGQFEQAGQTPVSDAPFTTEETPAETPETTPETATGGGGGGGGGGGSSQGMQGDLGLGRGMVGAQQNAFAGGSGAGADSLPDHDFGGGSGGRGGAGGAPQGGTPGGGAGSSAPDGGRGGAAAGIAGVAGSAAAGAAAKAIKDKKEQSS